MKCELIFYLAHRTGACEDALSEALAPAGIQLGAVAAATSPTELTYALAQAVRHSNLIFVVGGLNKLGGEDVLSVIGKALSLPLLPSKRRPGCRIPEGAGMLESGEQVGYAMESGRQTLVLLPDQPLHLTDMLQRQLLPFLCRKYGLTPPKGEIETSVQCLEQELPPQKQRDDGFTVAAQPAEPPPKTRAHGVAIKVLVIFLATALVFACGYLYYYFR